MPYTPITTTLGYVVRDGRVLMCHRVARSDDEQLGKWNGVGGKLERDEDVAACMLRELAEETGLVATRLELRGTVSWPGFGRNGEDHLGFVFRITANGEPPARNVEGDLAWVPLDEVMDLPMWEGDRHFLPLVLDDDPRPFHACLPYEHGRPVGWSVTRL